MYFECRLPAFLSACLVFRWRRPCLRRCLLIAQRTAWRACLREMWRGPLSAHLQLEALAGATPTLAIDVATSISMPSSNAAALIAAALRSIRRIADFPTT